MKVCFPGGRGRLLAERHVAEVMDTFDIALRLSAASIVGAVLGLNRPNNFGLRGRTRENDDRTRVARRRVDM
jgi:hypothetical protein